MDDDAEIEEGNRNSSVARRNRRRNQGSPSNSVEIRVRGSGIRSLLSISIAWAPFGVSDHAFGVERSVACGAAQDDIRIRC